MMASIASGMSIAYSQVGVAMQLVMDSAIYSVQNTALATEG